jgi:hypothetical protein
VPIMGYLEQKIRLKPKFYQMAHLPLKTLLREKNVRIWSHIFKNSTSTPQNPNKRKEC